ncbi:MAG TPA: hypothetical protein PK156_25815 [Polyangium sp.]|nr:hypothetical protein [Polyangium sp.]
MDPKHNGSNGYGGMFALGASGGASSYVMPGRDRSPTPVPGSFPRVDDHLVQPEVTRDIVVRGEKLIVQPAEKEHADAHARLDFVLLAHVLDNRTSSSDLITRVTKGSDFATDGSVRRSGTDPETGARYLEELSFEVVNEQGAGRARQKAEDLAYRGIRRIFGIFVKTGTVAEWSREKNEFVPLDPSSCIEDEALIRPVAVRALLDRAQAEIDVAKALIKKNNPEIAKLRQAAANEGHKKGHKKGLDEGELRGRRAMFREIMQEQFGDLSVAVISRIEQSNIEQIREWTKKLRSAASAAEVFAES